MSNFILHLLGDVPSPYLIGVFVQYIGYYFAIMFLSCWLVWASLFWWLGMVVAQTHGASVKDSLKVACKKNPRDALGMDSSKLND